MQTLDIGIMSSYDMEDDQNPFKQVVTYETLKRDFDDALERLDRDAEALHAETVDTDISMEDDRGILKRIWSVIKGLFAIINNTLASVINFVLGFVEWLVRRILGNKDKIVSWRQAKDEILHTWSIITSGLDYDAAALYYIEKAWTKDGGTKDGKLIDVAKESAEAIVGSRKIFDETLRRNDKYRPKVYKVFNAAVEKVGRSKDMTEIVENTAEAKKDLGDILTDKGLVETSKNQVKGKFMRERVDKAGRFTEFKQSNAKYYFKAKEVQGILDIIDKPVKENQKLLEDIAASLTRDSKDYKAMLKRHGKMTAKMQKIYDRPAPKDSKGLAVIEPAKAAQSNTEVINTLKLLSGYTASLTDLAKDANYEMEPYLKGMKQLGNLIGDAKL